MVEKENKVFVAIICSLILSFFVLLLCGKFLGNQVVKDKEDKGDSDTIKIDWESVFPYEKNIDTIKYESKTNEVANEVNIVTKASKLGNIGSSYAMYMYKYDEIAKMGFVIKSKLADVSVGSSYIKLKNGYWTQACTTEIDKSHSDNVIVDYASLQEYVRKQGKGFIYFYTPQKECKYDNQLPEGAVSYTNQHMDTYIDSLKDYGVNYVDLREDLHEQGIDHYSMFYSSDHHWTVKSGLWAASEVTNEINKQYGLSMKNPLDIGTYHDVVFKDAEFGSAGVGVTHFVCDTEDFIVPYPDFDTRFKLEVPSKGVDAEGSFEALFIDDEKIKELQNEGGGSAYGKILYGNQPYEKITNLNNTSGPKILMIRDSFSIAVAPYLAEVCSELVLLDVRPTNGNFNGSIVTCIDDFNPDVVMVLQCMPYKIELNKQ